MPPAAHDTIPADPLTLRARLHAYACAVAELPGVPAATTPLVVTWERLRAAWWALPAETRTPVETRFFALHPDCPGAAFRACPLASRARAATTGGA